MPSYVLSTLPRLSLSAFLMCGAFCGSALTQELALANASVKPNPAPSAPVVEIALPLSRSEHKFWDTKNRILFATVTALDATDFAVTRANLRSGGRELNPITCFFAGSTTGLAVNFAGETAGVIGISYFFHRTGHHKLERIVSMVNIGGSAGAVTYGLTHR
jgi:hypothetical protein